MQAVFMACNSKIAKRAESNHSISDTIIFPADWQSLKNDSKSLNYLLHKFENYASVLPT